MCVLYMMRRVELNVAMGMDYGVASSSSWSKHIHVIAKRASQELAGLQILLCYHLSKVSTLNRQGQAGLHLRYIGVIWFVFHVL